MTTNTDPNALQESDVPEAMPFWPEGTLIAKRETPTVVLGKIISPFNYTEGDVVYITEGGVKDRAHMQEICLYREPEAEVSKDDVDVADKYRN